MDEKSQKRLDKYSREELYELVWSEAMSTLSPKLGLSDVGLKKRCKRQGIPTPPRGYWAKLEAGKPVQKTPLPKKLPEKPAPKPIPLSKEEVGKFQPPRKDYSIARRLPLIAATQRALEIAPFNSEGLREVRGDGILQTKLSDESIGRGMWLWTELILRLKATGLKISVADGTFVVKKRKRVTIELKEMVAVYKSDSEQGRTSNFSSRSWAPTGVLVFRADRHDVGTFSAQWKDSRLRPLDERLDEIVSTLRDLVGQKPDEEFSVSSRPRRPPTVGPPFEEAGLVSRESRFPWDPARERRAPSDMAVQTIAYNDGLIEQVARFSAMQAMPILLANGERTTLSQQTDRLRELIEELIRRAIDDGDGHQQDMVGIFNVELIIAEQNGDGFTDQARNRYVLAVDVSIPLEHSVLPFPPKFYSKGRKIAEQWFDEN